jgi:Amt family ammonium transporter
VRSSKIKFYLTRTALFSVAAFLSGAASWAQEAAQTATPAAPAISAGDTAWVLASAALVMLMTPGLGLFYGGMVRRKNVLGTILQSLFMVALIGIQWVMVGYTLAFSAGNEMVGGLSWLFLSNLPAVFGGAPTIPHTAFLTYQAMFAIITPALITGAFAERVKFRGFILFSLLWATFVYDPVAHWIWGGGYWAKQGGLDFAGGAVVHITAGFSALALALLLGKRRGYGTEPMPPHNMTMVLTGTGILWFGWFGFNAGSALAANGQASAAFLATNTAGSMAALVWCLIESIHRGKPTALGAASGAIAGLAAVTPAAGFVDPTGAMIIGAVASLLCYAAILVKVKLKYDDSLDAFGVHGVGGFWGILATGLLANPAFGGHAGWFYGNRAQFVVQVQMALSIAAFSLVATVLLYLLVNGTVGFRADSREEDLGLDLSQHGEEGYTV